MGREIKPVILWFILSLVAVLFAMASVTSAGLMKYLYFIVSLVSCYGIRLFAKKENVSNGKR